MASKCNQRHVKNYNRVCDDGPFHMVIDAVKLELAIYWSAPLKDRRLLPSDPQWPLHPLQPQIILLILLLLSHPSPIFHLLLASNSTPPTILYGKLKPCPTLEVKLFLATLMAQSQPHLKKLMLLIPTQVLLLKFPILKIFNGFVRIL